MKTSLIKILTLTIVIVFHVTNSLAQMTTQNIMPKQQIDSIKQNVQKIIINAQHQFNLIGLSVAVLLPGQQNSLTFTLGSATIDNSESINSSSLFQIGSIAKTFTAVLIIDAINNKQLSLDDKLGNFFPKYVSWKDVTIRELLNQTSGIFDYIDSKDWWHKVSLSDNKVWDAKSLINIAYQHPVKFQHGKGWAYSNTNYVLLGLILEKVTHKSMDELMAALIQRTNLKDTYYFPHNYPENIVAKMAHGYGFYDTTYDMTTQNGSIWHAAAAMISLPKDLVSWWHALFATNLTDGFPITHYLQLKNTKDGKNVTEINQIGYDLGIFHMNTPEGIIWFTPGLTSGYIAGVVYAPCLDLYFTYSTNKAPVKGLHKFIMMNILHAMNNNKDYQKLLHTSGHVPSYCSQIKPAKEFIFPLQ